MRTGICFAPAYDGLRRLIDIADSCREGNSGGDVYGHDYGDFGKLEPSDCIDGNCAITSGCASNS
jgi:hypothetical protein